MVIGWPSVGRTFKVMGDYTSSKAAVGSSDPATRTASRD